MSDNCYSWVVAAACSLIFLLVSCPLRLAAQLFVFMLDRYDTTRREASFPFVLAQMIRCLSGPFAGVLGEIFGLQGVTITGCLLCAVGTGACFLAEDVLTINLCLGLIYGIGYSWSNARIPEILNHHFKKHRSKAYGLFLSGGGLASFLVPPILDIILNEYGASGTFLIMGAILFHAVPAAMLLTVQKNGMKKHNPTKNFDEMVPSTKKVYKFLPITANKSIENLNKEKRQNSICELVELPFLFTEQVQDDEAVVTNCSYKNISLNAPQIDEMISKSHITNKDVSEIEFQKEEKVEYADGFDTDNKIFDEIVTAKKIIYTSAANQNEYMKEMNNYSLKERRDKWNERLQENKYMGKDSTLNVCAINSNAIPFQNGEMEQICEKPISRLKDSDTSLMTKLSIIWSPVFLNIATILAVAGYVNQVFWTITVDFIRDKRIEREYEVYFVMCLSLFDTIGRLLLGTITDKGLMTITNFTILCYAFTGLILLLLPWLQELFSLMFTFSLMGLTFGGITIAMPALITNFVDSEKRGIAMASRLIIMAPVNLTISSAIGFFRGTLGSYDGLLYTMAAMCFVSVAILLLLSKLAKRRDRVQENKINTK